MGSFNTTCFATNQIIAEHDKCRVLPIFQSSTFSSMDATRGDRNEKLFGASNSRSHPTAYWEPAGAWIAAAYSDYGTFVPELSARNRPKLLTFFFEVAKRSPLIAQGENPSRDMSVDFASFVKDQAPGIQAAFDAQHRYSQSVVVTDDSLDTEILKCWTYLEEPICQGRVFLPNSSQGFRPVQLSVIHERSYVSLVALTSDEKDWDGNSLLPTEFLSRTIAQCRALAEEYMVAFAKEQDQVRPGLRAWSFADSFRGALGSLDSSNRYPRGVESYFLRELSVQLFEGKISENEFIADFTPWLLDRYALTGLDSMNLQIAPMRYSGQDYSNESGQRYAKFVASVSTQVTRERNDRR